MCARGGDHPKVVTPGGWRLKLLYDAQCPFCRHEAQWLKRRDRHGHLALEDINDPSFDPARYGLSREEVMAVLHGVLPDGHVLRRVDAVREAYRVVGLGWLVAPTTWPVLRWLTDRLYGAFARNRYRLGRLFGRRRDDAACRVHGGQ